MLPRAPAVSISRSDRGGMLAANRGRSRPGRPVRHVVGVVRGEFRRERGGQRPLGDLHAGDSQAAGGVSLSRPYADRVPVANDRDRGVHLERHIEPSGQRHHLDTVHLDVELVLAVRLDRVVVQRHDLVDAGFVT